MAEYAVSGTDSTVAADSIIHTERGSSKRHKWIYLTASSGVAPTDNSGTFGVQTVEAGSPAGTEPTPQKLDSTDGVAVTDAFTALTTEPTKGTTPLLFFAFNYRSWFVWNANPGKGFGVADTANHGLVLECLSSTVAQDYIATIHFEE